MKRGLFFLLIVAMFLSGCSKKIETHDPIFQKQVDEVTIEEYELPYGILDIFEMDSILGFYELNQIIYVVYSNGETGSTIMALDYYFNTLYKIEISGRVNGIEEAYSDNIMIDLHDDNIRYHIIYSNKGKEIIRMESVQSIRQTNNRNTRCPIYLGDGNYLYVKREDTNTLIEDYKLIMVNSKSESVIYEFNAYSSVETFQLEDKSMIFKIITDDRSVYDLIHISNTGEEIFRETTGRFTLMLLDDGYLFYGRDSVVRRDFSSSDIWEYQTEHYLNLREINDNSLTFKAIIDDERYEDLEIFNDGTFHSELHDFNQESQLRRFDISDDLQLVKYTIESDNSRQYYVEMHDDSGNVIWSNLYDESRMIVIENDMIYMQYTLEDNRVDQYIEVLDMNGTTVRIDIFSGQLVHVRENGNYILKEYQYVDESGGQIIFGGHHYLKEVNTDNELIWELEVPVQNHVFKVITDDLFVLSSYGYCMIEEWLCDRYFDTVVINGDGEIIKDFRESGSSYLLYFDEDYFYMRISSPNQVQVFNYEFEEVEAFEIFYQTGYRFLALKDEKLIVIILPYIINGYSWTIILDIQS